MSPNISLIIINRFSVSYGGDAAIATYACIAYVICIIYLILQGVGDGSQPLISKCYGERNWDDMKFVRKLAYGFAFAMSAIGCIIMYVTRGSLGILFGASGEVNAEIAKIMPVFLISVPFVAILRITTASFYVFCSLGWGLFSVILIKFLHPLLESIILKIPVAAASLISTILVAIYAADTALSVQSALQLQKFPDSQNAQAKKC